MERWSGKEPEQANRESALQASYSPQPRKKSGYRFRKVALPPLRCNRREPLNIRLRRRKLDTTGP